MLSGPEKFYCELECMKGMRDAFENNGKQNVSDYFIQTNMGKEDAFRKTLQLLKRKKPGCNCYNIRIAGIGDY